MPSETIHFVEITWNDGEKTRILVEIDFDAWLAEYVTRAAARPHWATLGETTFYTQNVRSIERIETIEKED